MSSTGARFTFSYRHRYQPIVAQGAVALNLLGAQTPDKCVRISVRGLFIFASEVWVDRRT
jgi:hypothetical protein